MRKARRTTRATYDEVAAGFVFSDLAHAPVLRLVFDDARRPSLLLDAVGRLMAPFFLLGMAFSRGRLESGRALAEDLGLKKRDSDGPAG